MQRPGGYPRGKIRSLKHPSPVPRGEGSAADRRLRAPPNPVVGQWVLPAYPVDKSADFFPRSGYPQLSTGQSPPFPQGFRPINILLKQIDNLVLHEIQHYHHHKAFDLFPDLKLCSHSRGRSRGGSFLSADASRNGNLQQAPRRLGLAGVPHRAGQIATSSLPGST